MKKSNRTSSVMLKLTFCALLILDLIQIGLALRPLAQERPDSASALPPLYVTIITHNEEPSRTRSDYLANRNFYIQNRALVKRLAETITSKGATCNFQSDWNFLQAVARYDTGSVTNDTGGKNIVRWLSDDPRIEVDPHAHETRYNYADVVYLIEQLGVAPSKTVGGFLYWPPDNPQGWEQHIKGIFARVYPQYFWRADLLWGAATALHQGLDEHGSGLWRPKDRYNFTTHDPDQRLIYIGGCGALGNQQQAIVNLLNAIESGQAPPYGFYTATMTIAQDGLTEQSIAQLGRFIDSLLDEVATGRVRWATLSEIAEKWQTEYGTRPFRYDCDTGRVTITPSAEADTPAAATNRYVIFGYNANVLWGAPNQVKQADPMTFTATLNRHLDLFDRLGGKADYYFTGLAAERLAQWSPQTVSRLLASPYGLNYHGANRPPYPAPVTFVRGLNWEEDIALMRTYEREGRNPRTGEHVGGIAGWRSVFGRAPFSTGRYQKGPILAVSKEMGARMGVGLQENTGAYRNDGWFMGLVNRPEQISFEPEPLIDAAISGRATQFLSQIRTRLASLTGSIQVVAFLIHDHDLFQHAPDDNEKVWRLYEQLLLLTQELGFQSVTLPEIAALVRNGPAPTLSKAVLLQAAQSLRQTMAATGYPPDYVTASDGTPYSLAEVFEALARSLAAYRQTSNLPETIATSDLLGPTATFTSNTMAASIPADQVLAAAVAVVEGMTDRLPSRVTVGTRTINPAEFLYLMAQQYAALAQGTPTPVSLRAVSVLPTSVIQNRQADELTKLQFWTFKPIVWAVNSSSP